MSSPETPLDTFVNTTAKTTIAVILPLYGYWNDIQNNPVNGEVLNAILKRVYSNIHNVLLVFVANPETIPNDPQDPESVANILMARAQGGNVKNIPVARTAPYAEYVREGMEYALEETNAAFVVVMNPWVMIQEGGIDALVNRANRGDGVSCVSGFNVRSVIDPMGFDKYSTPVPKEEWDINFDFFATPRWAAETIAFDPSYKTRDFLQIDIFQSMRSKGYSVVSSQQLPIFTFDFPWKDYQTREMFDEDRVYFMSKWGFDPEINYEAQP